MDGDVELLKRIYDRFNARDIDGALTALTDDVAWANGMVVATSMAARPYASTGRASGPWSVRTSSLWAFIELRMARSSQRSGSPSAISKVNRSRGRRTGLKTRRSDTFSVFERARWLASTYRMLPNSNIHGIERLQRIAKLAEIFFGFGKVGPQVVHGAS